MTASPNAAPPPRQIADDDSAPAAVRRLYADIRETLDTSIVNLVFRRLAGIDFEVLEAVWRMLRPAYRSGSIGARAAMVTQGIAAEIARAASTAPAIRVDNASLPTVKALIAGYNQNNARNLIAFAALLGAVPGDPVPTVAGAPSPFEAAAGTPGIVLPALPAIEALPDGLADLVRRLNRFGDTNEPGNPIASLYLHLTHWPEVLERAEMTLAPLDADGTLARWRKAAGDRAAALALPKLAAPPDLCGAIEPVLWSLVGCTLPKMIPIGGLLRALLEDPT